MTKYLSITLAALLAVLVPTVAPAVEVEVRSPLPAAAIVFDAVTVTSAVAVKAPTSGAYDLRLFSSFTCEIANANDGGAARVATPTCYSNRNATGAATFTYPTISVNTNAKGRYVFDPRTSAATADTGVTDSPNVPCAFMRMEFAAAQGNATISCTARR